VRPKTRNQFLYINGVLDTGVTKTGTAEAINGISNSKNLSIGEEVDDDQNSFHGTLDDIRVYNRALSPDEIKRLYNMGR
jgi:hypothetical protein